MDWIKNTINAVANPIGTIGSAIGGEQGRRIANVINPVGMIGERGARMVNNYVGGGQGQTSSSYNGMPIQTPGEAARDRQLDISQGQARFRNMMSGDKNVQDIIRMRKEGLQGLNAQEQTAARDQMMRGLLSQQQQATRSLAANQARSGVRGGMAGAQQARLQRQIAQDRMAGEQKLMLDNYALKQRGLDSYQDLMMRQKFGELAQGLGEAGLGVADRTGYMQALIGQQMAQAASQQPQRGFFGQLLGDLF